MKKRKLSNMNYPKGISEKEVEGYWGRYNSRRPKMGEGSALRERKAKKSAPSIL